MSGPTQGPPNVRPDGPPGGLTRRRALQVLGLAAGGAAAGCGAGEKQAAAAAPAPAQAAPTPAPPPGYFTPHERETVNVLVDYIIPRDERSGSATEAGVPAWMDAFLADADTEPLFAQRVRGGLAWLDADCQRRFAGADGAPGPTFVRADDAQRRQVLDAIAYPAKAAPAARHGVAFFSLFRDLTASGFYSSRMGYDDLRYQGNVAVAEWRGCPDEANARLGVSQALMAARPAPRDPVRRV